MSDKQIVRDIAQLVSRYLEANPQATETASGVAQWWLAQSRMEAALEDVEAALDYLVRQGVVKRTQLRDGAAVYSRVASPR